MSISTPVNEKIFTLGFVALALGCFEPRVPDPLSPGGIHVLFIGNSLTYVNDLPATVAALGELSGDTIRVASATGPDLALIDHYHGASTAVKQINQGRWDFVVMQQGPTSVPGVGRDTLILATQLFDSLIRATGGKTALFMVWPSIDRFAFFDEVRKSYQMAADTVHGVFMPAGAAWLEAWNELPSIALYSGDGLHPTQAGTLVAALVIYEKVTGKDARSLPSISVGAGSVAIDSATVRVLEGAAHAANVRYP